MTREQAQEAITLLSLEFGVKAPRLDYKRARRGRYFPRESRLVVGPNAWRGTEASLLHEFAHHLVSARQPKLNADDRAVLARNKRMAFTFDAFQGVKRERASHHGPTFVRCLREVVKAWGVAYDLDKEYRSVKSEYLRQEGI